MGNVTFILGHTTGTSESRQIQPGQTVSDFIGVYGAQGCTVTVNGQTADSSRVLTNGDVVMFNRSKVAAG